MGLLITGMTTNCYIYCLLQLSLAVIIFGCRHSLRSPGSEAGRNWSSSKPGWDSLRDWWRPVWWQEMTEERWISKAARQSAISSSSRKQCVEMECFHILAIWGFTLIKPEMMLERQNSCALYTVLLYIVHVLFEWSVVYNDWTNNQVFFLFRKGKYMLRTFSFLTF